MATDDPRSRYHGARKRLEKSLESGDVTEGDYAAITEFLDAIDPDNFNHQFVSGNGQQETKAPGTLAAYTQALNRVATLSDAPIREMTEDEVNELFGSLADGTHPEVKDSGYGKSTLSQWQSAVSMFFQYHGGPADPDNIVVVNPGDSSVDEDDMFTPEEVQALRDATENPRDRCLLELFLNTGQRIRAVQTIKYGDVDPDAGATGRFRLNAEADGLKGAAEVQEKRPLLGAKRAVKDWMQYHPTKDPDDYLVTVLPSANRGTPGDTLSQTTMRRTMRKIAEQAGIDDPKRASNVHNFRHHFVTVCKRDYDMEDAVIKRLIGHGEESRIMEKVYSHLTDDDIIEKAEVATGDREPGGEESLTPATCPTCDEPLAPDAKACSRCGMVFTPDAKAAEDQLQEDVKQAYADTDPDDTEAQEKLEALDELLSDPELRRAVLDRIDGE